MLRTLHLPKNAINSNNKKTHVPFTQKNVKQHTFPKIDIIVMVKGEYMTTHPFLELCLESEHAFFFTLAVEKPFIAPFWTIASAWKTFIMALNKQRDIDNKLVFIPPATERSVRDCVNYCFNVF